MFRNVVTTEQVMNDVVLWPGVLTRLMACPPTCGAAAAIVVSEAFAKKHGLRTDVLIAGQSMATDIPASFETRDMIRVVGFEVTRLAAQQAYAQAGIGVNDIDVIELHDCFAQNELLTYEALACAPRAKAPGWSPMATTPMAASGWSIRPAVCSPRATRWALPA